MKNPTYEADLAAWGRSHGLTASARLACAHGLRGLREYDLRAERLKDEHADFCRHGYNLDLLDHGSLWLRRRQPVVLLAHCYRPAPKDAGHEAWAERLERYCQRFGLRFLTLSTSADVPRYDTEATPVLYARTDRELAEFAGPVLTGKKVR